MSPEFKLTAVMFSMLASLALASLIGKWFKRRREQEEALATIDTMIDLARRASAELTDDELDALLRRGLVRLNITSGGTAMKLEPHEPDDV